MTERCPVCGRELSADPALAPHRPFCSKRCQQVDLIRWSEGKYAIVEPVDPGDDGDSLPPDEFTE